MTRWIVRLLGLLMLLVMLAVFAHMHQQLLDLQRSRGEKAVPRSSSGSSEFLGVARHLA
jgi:hypothetical protein